MAKKVLIIDTGTAGGQPIFLAKLGIAAVGQIPAHQATLTASPQDAVLVSQSEDKVPVAIVGPARGVLDLSRFRS